VGNVLGIDLGHSVQVLAWHHFSLLSYVRTPPALSHTPADSLCLDLFNTEYSISSYSIVKVRAKEIKQG
jgi:hypothetical protein